ncbi:PREDICTED: rho GTPase-activating protein gacJJ-like isoform X2 [Branchiostoma belcheri]|uniref:Rho GTPase-activating protein gacJJ-like isoform X2 n=1 Tax=Branchiostoma belcheri TaxID=7741 RepID=A0A6P4Z478_BRABE|nr:PREDICTED: rho GTPase-activating protein gacJJ-like isoform X2 [Branchiostoma belcheri]
MTEVISPVRRLFKIAIIAGSVAGGVLVLTAILLVALTVCRRDKHRAAWTQCQLVNVVPPIPESEMEVAPNNCDEDFDKLAHDGDISPDRCVARAIMPYEVSEPGLLHLNVNDVVEVLKTGNDGWWFGYCQGKVGAFPAACVEILTKPDTLSRGANR